MKITDPHLKWNEGDLFRYRRHLQPWTELEGAIGIIIRKVSYKSRYKVQVDHKTLWVTIHNMEEI